MRPRIFVLPLAAAVIGGMVWYKLSQTHPRGNDVRAVTAARISAPAFEALDQDNSITRLRTFLGRHNLFVVFFDGETGADSDRTLLHLKQHVQELKAADYHVIAISSALPQQNRTTDFPSVFHLLTDPAPIWKIHREWGPGCFDEETGTPIPAIFHIDPAGNVTGNSRPIPLTNPDTQIDALLGLTHADDSN
jgi:peroxiredoxin